MGTDAAELKKAIKLRSSKASPSSSKRTRKMLASHYEEDDALTDEEPLTKKKKSAKKAKEDLTNFNPTTPEDYKKGFGIVGFTHTRYPDDDTLERLGIKEDVDRLLEGCGLKKYAYMRQCAYPDLAAEFLATCKLSSCSINKKMVSLTGGGDLTFTINGKECTRTLKEIEDHFGFPPGVPQEQEFNDQEVNQVWEMLTGDAVFHSKCKASRIRHPAVAYVRKVIAETFFSRDKTGPCTTSDFHILVEGIRKTFRINAFTKEPIVGDTNNASLAYLLCKQLCEYRGKLAGSLKKGSDIAEFCIGGPITEIIKIEEEDVDWGGKRYEPGMMNIPYLHTKNFLAGPRDGATLYYKFQHPDQAEARIVLPNKQLTSLDAPERIMFTPPLTLLRDPKNLKRPLLEEGAPLAVGETSTAARRKRATPIGKGKQIGTNVQLASLRSEIEAEITPRIERRIIARIVPQLIEEITAKIKDEYAEELVDNIMNRLEPEVDKEFLDKLHGEMIGKICADVRKRQAADTVERLRATIKEDIVKMRQTIATKLVAKAEERTDEKIKQLVRECDARFVQRAELIPAALMPAPRVDRPQQGEEPRNTKAAASPQVDQTKVTATKRKGEASSSGQPPKKDKKGPPTPPPQTTQTAPTNTPPNAP